MPEDYYPNRPLEIENMSLHKFMSWYDYKTSPCAKSHTNCHKLKNNKGFIHKRSEAKVLKTPNIKCINEKSTELYFHNILYLFLPWRNENELSDQSVSYFDKYEKSTNENLIDQNSFQHFDIGQQRTNLATQRAKEIIDNLENNPSDHESDENDDQNIEAELGILEYPYDHVNPINLQEKIIALNNEQKDVFTKVTNTIEHIDMHDRGQCSCKHRPKALRLFCSGVAGELSVKFLTNPIRLNYICLID